MVFMTGPNYDSDLQSAFPGSKLKEIPGEDARFLARVEGNSLPENSFRTYHPNYLVKSKLAERALGKIVELQRNGGTPVT